MAEGLVYVGKIVEIHPIPGADLIDAATVVCGSGGIWRGVVPKGIRQDKVLVYLPDAVVPNTPQFAFMEQHKYRVKQRMFKGVPSECLIMDPCGIDAPIGADLTDTMNVTKYEKPMGSFGLLQGQGTFRVSSRKRMKCLFRKFNGCPMRCGGNRMLSP